MQHNGDALSNCLDSVISGVVVRLTQDPSRRQRAIAEIAAHPAIRVAAIKDQWLPIAVEARDESETRNIHHWITSLDGVDVADVVAISCGVPDTEVVSVS